MNTRQKAPRTVGSNSSAACSMLESAAPPRVRRECPESVVAAPGALWLIRPALRARSANSAVLTRFPLCPRATPVPAAVLQKHRLGVFHVVDPVVE